MPLTELGSTVKSLNSGIHSIILDGSVDKELAEVAEKAKVKFVVGMDSKVKPEEAKVTILTSNDL